MATSYPSLFCIHNSVSRLQQPGFLRPSAFAKRDARMVHGAAKHMGRRGRSSKYSLYNSQHRHGHNPAANSYSHLQETRMHRHTFFSSKFCGEGDHETTKGPSLEPRPLRDLQSRQSGFRAAISVATYNNLLVTIAVDRGGLQP